MGKWYWYKGATMAAWLPPIKPTYKPKKGKNNE